MTQVIARWFQTGKRAKDGYYQTDEGWTRTFSGAWQVKLGEEVKFLGWNDVPEEMEKRFRGCAIVFEGGPSNGLVLGGYTKVNWRE